MKNPWIVAGIGELLWDMFPEGKRMGGAPVNFSYHCHQLGATSYPVSAIGDDELGAEMRAVLLEKGLPDSFIAVTGHPTGTVEVTLEGGKPSYEISEGVAWDHLPFSGALTQLAPKVDAVCFGSLAQRTEGSRATIHALLGALRPGALKIFDVNLRQKFFAVETIEASLKRSNVLKLSDEELPVLADMFRITGSVSDQLEVLRSEYDLNLVAYTRGPDGSVLVTADGTDDHPGCTVAAVDSVGAGDSFTATLCLGLLDQRPLSEINDHANRTASFVCSQMGATPVLPKELLEG